MAVSLLDLQDTRSGHAGFTVLDASVVVEEPERYSADDLVVICEACLTEHHPGLEDGMAIAEEHGEARFLDGRWVGA